jgi:hypothetical protein
MPYLIAFGAIFAFSVLILAYGVITAKPYPPDYHAEDDEARSHELEDDIQHGPDGSRENGTKSH